MQPELIKDLMKIKDILINLSTVIKQLHRTKKKLQNVKAKNPFMDMLLTKYCRQLDNTYLEMAILKGNIKILSGCKSLYKLKDFYTEETYPESWKILNIECREFLYKEFSFIISDLKKHYDSINRIFYPAKEEKEFISLLEGTLKSIKSQSDLYIEILEYSAKNTLESVLKKYVKE